MAKLEHLMTVYYMQYAVETILARAIPFIDGLKPVHRHILYTMYKMGLQKGDKTKSANIVGQVMRLHPHGDQSIYDTMVRMTNNNLGLNVPYIEGKGNFGLHFSGDLAYAAPRYTEAKLADIAECLFDGIDEDAVRMINNYDNTMKEPLLLPVKFPSIIVNPVDGIAVAFSSSIPSFSLKNSCNAVIGMLKGEINTTDELMEVLGVPEYTTGGVIHTDKETLRQLGDTGNASFSYSGFAVREGSSLIIRELPYNARSEDIIKAINEKAGTDELREVVEAKDETDINGFSIRVTTYPSRVTSYRKLFEKLCRLTDLRTTISYKTNVIIDGKLRTLGIHELLKEWIKFRRETINRVYTFRYNKASKEAHRLEAWDKVKHDIDNLIKLIVSYRDEDDKLLQTLMTTYSLDEEQASYIMDTRLKEISRSNIAKKLEKLASVRENIRFLESVIHSDAEKDKIIISELEEIVAKYGRNNNVKRAGLIVPDNESESDTIDDSEVTVLLTKDGFVKRFIGFKVIDKRVPFDGHDVDKFWYTKNTDTILIFTNEGDVYKVPVTSIDSSKKRLRDELYKLAGLPSYNSMLFVDMAGEYTNHFNVVFSSGRAFRVSYAQAKGNRKKYKNVFPARKYGSDVFITTSDKFFIITKGRKAAYKDMSFDWLDVSKYVFKVARITPGDAIFAIQPESNVPDMSVIDLDKYTKGYTVSINDDVLWEGAKNPGRRRKKKK